MSIASHFLRPDGIIKRNYARALEAWRRNNAAGRRLAAKRDAIDRMLDRLARDRTAHFEGTVLVDAMWNNPNYWLRFSLLRGALGLAHGREIGLIGSFKQTQCRATLARFGIKEVLSFPDTPLVGDVDAAAASLLARTRAADDVLAWQVPGGVHPTIVYDGILKLQRRATLDTGARDFARLTRDALRALARGATILDRTKPDLLLISHPLNVTYGGLAWQALARGIPVVLLFGLFGVLRFARFARPEDLFSFYDRPTRDEIDRLEPRRAEALAAIGRQYLAGRLEGRADDLASIYAFKRNSGAVDRAQLCAMHGWDPARPIVAFYASNWFDWPHQLGMTQFRDFLDWTQATHAAAVANTDVNWLFKPHPAENWFGGVALAEVLRGEGAPNIAIADERWNNAAVMHAVDAMVTYHGTAGVEFAALGKPVLVPDRGKYDDCGFVRLAEDRDDYLRLLGRRWWSDMNLDEVRRRAEIFAGWWFCAPEWQRGFVFADDARQDTLYDTIPQLIAANPQELERELATLAAWWQSGHRYYHTFKMGQADSYRLTNIA